MKIHNHLYHDVISSTSMFKFIKKSVINIWYMAFITFCNKCMVCGIYQKSVINIRFMSMILVKFCNKCMVYAIQVWGQIHWNIFKYKYFWMYYKYKYFSNEKNKFIVFLWFLFWHTHYITSQHQLDLSHQFMNFLLITPEEHKMFKILVGMSGCISWNNEWYMLEG